MGYEAKICDLFSKAASRNAETTDCTKITASQAPPEPNGKVRGYSAKLPSSRSQPLKQLKNERFSSSASWTIPWSRALCIALAKTSDAVSWYSTNLIAAAARSQASTTFCWAEVMLGALPIRIQIPTFWRNCNQCSRLRALVISICLMSRGSRAVRFGLVSASNSFRVRCSTARSIGCAPTWEKALTEIDTACSSCPASKRS
mmetsp:Transcript_100151/g.238801  ORF Transcript_100151/g.238801 Transcript_100151/m.238801 type:complete len:202 (-) Transcript_100151:1417-2022(-)